MESVLGSYKMVKRILFFLKPKSFLRSPRRSQFERTDLFSLSNISKNYVNKSNEVNFIFNMINRFLFLVEKQMNSLAEQRQTAKENNMKLFERKIDDIKTVIHLSNEKTREKNEIRIDCENKLHYIRRQRINETYKYVFPIEYAAAVEE